MTKVPRPRATPAQVQARRALVAQHYMAMPNKDLAALLGVAEHIVRSDALALGLQKPTAMRVQAAHAEAARKRALNPVWPKAHLLDLDRAYADQPTAALALRYGKSEDAVRAAARKRGLHKNPAQARPPEQPRAARPFRAPENRAALANLFATTPAAKLAELFGCTVQSVRRQVRILGLKKPQATLTSIHAADKRPTGTAPAARITYPAGALPWRAQAMLGPAWEPPPLTHRSSAANH